VSFFQFKHFSIQQSRSALKVGTDAMLLGALIDTTGKTNALDIGTGTGVLSLMVAQKNDHLIITAIDIDAESLEDCRENVKNSSWGERISVLQEDILQFQSQRTYDLIFSNPPFYQNSLLSSDQRVAASKHADQLSFDRLFQKVSELLSEHGRFWAIFPGEYDDQIIELSLKNGLCVGLQIRIEGVPGRHTRTVFEFSVEEVFSATQTLVVRGTKGRYTQDYIELTKAYHDRSLS
jgi:tRNA1Val (adenine37-N6)-methyltransferase